MCCAHIRGIKPNNWQDTTFSRHKQKKPYYNVGTKTTKYNVGKFVLLKAPPTDGKFTKRWNGPFQIIRNDSDISYKIQNTTNKKQKAVVHANRLKL